MKAKPDLAAAKLSQAIAEVAKTLQAVDSSAVRFLSLGIDADALAKNSSVLLTISGGDLATEIERGRGHCHVIGEIYNRYLDRWFEAAWKPEEYQNVQTLFLGLGSADMDLFRELGRVAESLEQEAQVALELVFKGKEGVARDRIRAAFPVLAPLRKTLSHTMQTLYAMQSDFVQITSAV